MTYTIFIVGPGSIMSVMVIADEIDYIPGNQFIHFKRLGVVVASFDMRYYGGALWS